MRKRATLILVAALAPLLLGASSASSAHPSSAHTPRPAAVSKAHHCDTVSWYVRHDQPAARSPKSG